MSMIRAYISNVQTYFSRLELAKKIRLMLLLVSLIPLACLFVVVYQISSSIIHSQTNELIQANLEQSASNVESFWRTCEGIIQSIYTDDFYREEMECINNWDNNQYNGARTAICKRLENITVSNPSIMGIAIIGEKYDVCFYDEITVSSQNSYCFPIETYGNGQKLKEITNNREIRYSSLEHLSSREYGADDVIYVSSPLESVDEGSTERPYGYIVICIKEEALRRVYEKSNTESNLTMVVNNYGDLLSVSTGNAENINLPEETGVFSEDDVSEIKEANLTSGVEKKKLEEASLLYVKNQKLLESKNLLVSSIQLKEGCGYVINVQDTDYALRNFRYMIGIIVCFCVLAGIACLLLTLRFSGQVDTSVKPILQAMDQANHGDMEARIEVRGNDEFTRISEQFNYMIGKIHQSNEQEKESLVRVKNAEIKSLEAQINPHFLYNTLDAINWVALDNEEYTISKMLTSLAAILRYSIHKSNEIVEIQDELEYLKRYVYLQQQRFDYSFICTIDVEEGLRHYRIHKLMIQPLLENTLVHAFPGNTGMDEVNIRIGRTGKEDMLEIVVEDNGVGMSQEQVGLFNHFDYQKEKIESSIGVRNVITRLKLYYGGQGSFHVESWKGTEREGTRITMKIPYEV